ncbi:YccT family protein [Biostraticola tofi]|uniref:Uncharacterized protein n=1 Tax=Biostraticola tofi TaxID=466109 RepID=A0A4R3YZV6_9GAMM|nr:DUF2057 family protein [Biostraticola tofi]TCV98186.1 hypothetical protein EDC52_103272 [Biostraticola tofi]
MNFLRAIVIGISLVIGFPALATSLQLPEELELLIVDGKALGGSLLRGAASLELEKGHHQVVFTLKQRVSAPGDKQHLYTSPFIIITFDPLNAARVKFELPALTTQKEAEKFSRQPSVKLVDHRGTPVQATVARLDTDRQGLMQAVNNYNRRHGLESLIHPQSTPQDIASSVAARKSQSPAESQTEQMLRFWFLQADTPTRTRFMRWAEHHQSDEITPPSHK